MGRIVVQKSMGISGELMIGSAKNSILPIMAASLLTDEDVVLECVPSLVDVALMKGILESLGAQVTQEGERMIIRNRGIRRYEVAERYARRMRASFLVMGPLLTRFGRGELPLPGGCQIGSRPINLHLKGLEAMGARY